MKKIIRTYLRNLAYKRIKNSGFLKKADVSDTNGSMIYLNLRKAPEGSFPRSLIFLFLIIPNLNTLQQNTGFFTIYIYNLPLMIESKQPPFKPSLAIKTLIGYIYFMQGIYLALIGSIVYLYPVFPKPDVLSTFSIASLPFSFKFLTAPFVEKYTVQSYGPRKFWISLSLFGTSILTYPLGLIADTQQKYLMTVVLLFAIIVFISLGDIATDAVAVKQLQDPVLAGYLQSCMQPLGVVTGTFLVIQSVNPTFWRFLEIEGPLCSTQSLFTVLSVIGFIIAIVVHFRYKERISEEQKEDEIPDFKTIFKYYLHFVNPKYSLCRTVIYYLLVYQGLKFFSASFGAEAVYRGFEKANVANIQNVCILVAFVINTLLSKIITKQKTFELIFYLYFTEFIAYVALYYSNSFDNTVVFATIFFIDILSYIRFLAHSTLTNSFGHSRFAGLCITTLASFINMGNNQYIQLKLYGKFGYERSVMGGLILALIIGVFLKRLLKWMNQGAPQTHADKQFHEKHS